MVFSTFLYRAFTAHYLLAIGTDVVPSIIVLTVEEWGRLQKREAPLWQTVTRDGVAVQ